MKRPARGLPGRELDVLMSDMSTEWDDRALWLGKHVLPHEQALRAWLRGRRVHGVEVDDIIQETYTRLLQTKSVEHIRNPKTYAFQTAGSVLVDRMRLVKVVPITAVANIEQLQIMSDIPSPERQVIDREELFRLAEAIGQLPEKARLVFTMRRIDGLSQREVAEKIGISENTVEKHMSRALLLLLRVFRDSGKAAPQASSPRTSSELIGHDAYQDSQRD